MNRQDQETGRYLGFFVCDKGTGIELSKHLLKYLKTMKIDISRLICLGADGTSANTGYKVHYIERYRV